MSNKMPSPKKKIEYKRRALYLFSCIILIFAFLVTIDPKDSYGKQSPEMASPPPGTTLAASTVTFQWSAGSGVSQYWLGVGTSFSSIDNAPFGDIYGQETGSNTSAQVSGIPLDGNPVYVRLWYETNIGWEYGDYIYQTVQLQTSVSTSKSVYAPNEQIVVFFSNGPGNQLDWIGLYPLNATQWEYLDWLYVDGTQSGSTGYTDGSVTFISGLPSEGNYEVRFLENNGSTVLASSTFSVQQSPVLTLSITDADMSENGGSSLTTVTRSAGTSGDLEVNLSSSDTSEATVPASVTILDGSATASITVTAVDDAIEDGTQTVTITASAPSYTDGADTIDVTDDDGNTPVMLSPIPGSVLTSSAVTFEWSAGIGVDQYWLGVGTSLANIDGSSSYGNIYGESTGVNTSALVTGIPLNGNTVYVRLWYEIGSVWYFSDYTYQASNPSSPEILSPTPGSTLSSINVTFQWSAGIGVVEYWLGVGTSLANIDGSSSYGNIYGESTGVNTSVLVTGIPLNGNTVYVRLWYKIGSAWYFLDYTYQTPSDPFVEIIEPQNYHLQVNSDLLVRTTVYNLLSNYGIKFILDASQELFDFTEPFEVTFMNLDQTEHVVDAYIVDEFGEEVTGVYVHDQIVPVGIGGYYVTMGDSITFGWADDIAYDNVSFDGRNGVGGGFEGGSGYAPILNDLLTDPLNGKGYPHTVINEGINSTKSVDGLALIGSLLVKHSGAQYFLIQYGTNDARILDPTPSGEGLSPGQSGYPGSFKDNMQQIIAAVTNAGKETYLAKIPYPMGVYTYKNEMIQAYNRVVDELRVANSIGVEAPDFYDWFRTHPNEYNEDGLHPNGTGYQSMANLWFLELY